MEDSRCCADDMLKYVLYVAAPICKSVFSVTGDNEYQCKSKAASVEGSVTRYNLESDDKMKRKG